MSSDNTARAPLPQYSRRHLDPAQAAAYGKKFRRSWLRRLSSRRETRLVGRALDLALDWLAERGRARDAVVLLDYPCGAGRFAALAAGRVAGYIAGDHSPHMLSLTAAALDRAGLADRLRRTVEGDAREIGLPDREADLGMCMRLLHHFELRSDRVRILTELRRVIDGPLVTSFLDADAWKQRRHVARLAKAGRSSRRVLLTRSAFAEEAAAAGWVSFASWPLSSVFSGQRVALCLPPVVATPGQQEARG